MKNQVNKIANKIHLTYKTKKSPTLGKKINTACQFLSKNNMGNNCCKKCVEDMPKKIQNIRFALNVDMNNKIEKICKKHSDDRVIGTYCKKCKQLLLMYSGNISQFSSEKLNKQLTKQDSEIIFLY